MKSVIYIRPLFKNDWDEVSKIYKAGMDTGIATFETEVPKWKKWKKSHLLEHCYVAQKHDKVVGFAGLAPYSHRKVYYGVAEVSVYVHTEHKETGVGKELLNTLIRSSEEKGLWTLQASIFPENKASLKLHQSCGFKKIGTREKIAQRNGKWYDNVLMERRIKV